MADRTDRLRPRLGAAGRVAVLVAGAAALVGCNPMASWTNNQSGKSLYRTGRYVEAREEFRQAAADSPRNADYIHNYATASRRAGDHATAEQAYRRALWIDPSHQPSYHGLAVTLNETCRRDVARIARRTGYHLRFSKVTPTTISCWSARTSPPRTDGRPPQCDQSGSSPRVAHHSSP